VLEVLVVADGPVVVVAAAVARLLPPRTVAVWRRCIPDVDEFRLRKPPRSHVPRTLPS